MLIAWPAMPDLSQLRKFRQKTPFCSQSALEGILDLASKEGIPENYKRKQIRQSVEQTIESLNTYGPLLVAATAMTLAEEPMEIVFANIFSYIAGAYAAGGCFANFLDMVHSNNPSGYHNPWKCVLYADEIHPGNQLAGSSRKSWALYLSFAEFGSMLSHSEVWFTIFVMRSDLMGNLAANIGQIYRLVLEHMFNNQQAHPHAGVLFHRGAARLKLFWTLGFFIQDGSAQKYTFSNKQDAGSRICFNILMSKSFLLSFLAFFSCFLFLLSFLFFSFLFFPFLSFSFLFFSFLFFSFLSIYLSISFFCRLHLDIGTSKRGPKTHVFCTF